MENINSSDTLEILSDRELEIYSKISSFPKTIQEIQTPVYIFRCMNIIKNDIIRKYEKLDFKRLESKCVQSCFVHASLCNFAIELCNHYYINKFDSILKSIFKYVAFVNIGYILYSYHDNSRVFEITNFISTYKSMNLSKEDFLFICNTYSFPEKFVKDILFKVSILDNSFKKSIRWYDIYV